MHSLKLVTFCPDIPISFSGIKVCVSELPCILLSKSFQLKEHACFKAISYITNPHQKIINKSLL